MSASRLWLAGVFLSVLWIQAARAETVKSPSAPDPCSTEKRLAAGGSFTATKDDTRIWYKLSGKAGAPIIAYVHGGPGYNAYVFEESAGKLLEADYRLLYLDQRGCGRSGFDGSPDQYGMAATIEDIEHLRALVGADRLILAAHSFGGVVAAAYAHRYASRVSAIIMIDTAPDLSRALAYQVSYINSIADKAYAAKSADVNRIAGSDATAVEKLTQLYTLLGRLPIQQNLMYARAPNQTRMEALDEESGFLRCTSGKVVQAFLRDGYMSSNPPGADRRLQPATLLIAGRASHIIGEDNIRSAAETWGARLEWMSSGHFVYFEQPEEFAAIVKRFISAQRIRE